jgi:glycosyltransferase involved in cell wall biosynthesis
MRLLQVSKRPEILGGTTACVHSICQALPDWSHAVFSCWPGEVPQRTRDAFAADGVHELEAAPVVAAETLRRVAPDVILLHNVEDHDLPPEILPEEVPVFYYCHGSYDGRLERSAGLRAASRDVFFVSEFLARQAGVVGSVLYQPVPPPPDAEAPRPEPAPLVVGRLCNPRAENWTDEVVAAYGLLAERCPGVLWELVGCPAERREAFAAACGDVVFHEAGVEARRHLRRWHAMLYHTPVTHAYGRTLCEAQQAGCVPVVDRRGGFVEQIEHGRTGFLGSTVDELAAALAELQQPARWRACSAAARAAGAERGSLDRWRARFLEIWELCRLAA